MKKNSKKHSALYLASMQTTGILLVILILMTIAELAVFYVTSTRMTKEPIEVVLETSQVFWVSKIGCAIYCAAMVFTKLNSQGAFPAYTLARLNETRTKQRVENYIYNLLCIIILWGALIFTYYGMYLIYTKTSESGYFGRHVWTLVISAEPYLVSFMPMFFVDRWINLAILIFGTPIMITEAARHMKGLSIFIPGLYLGYVTLMFEKTAEMSDISIIPAILIVIEVLYNLSLDYDKKTKYTKDQNNGIVVAKEDPIEKSVSTKKKSRKYTRGSGRR